MLLALPLLANASMLEPLEIEANYTLHVVFIGVDPSEANGYEQYVSRELTPTHITAPLPYTFRISLEDHRADGGLESYAGELIKRHSTSLADLLASPEAQNKMAPLSFSPAQYRRALEERNIDPTKVLAVDAAEFLQGLTAYVYGRYPELAYKNVLFVLCGEALVGRPVSYYVKASSIDTGNTAYDVGLVFYGGGWWGRTLMVDVCTLPHPLQAYRALLNDVPIMGTWKDVDDRSRMLGTYVDLALRFAFIRGNIYRPKFADNILVEIWIVDLSDSGLTYRQLQSLFDGEAFISALKTLYPYAYFAVHFYLLEGRPDWENLRRELRNVVSDAGDRVTIDMVRAYLTIRKSGIVERPPNVFVVPVFVLVTEKPSSLGGIATGVALPEMYPSEEGEPWGVLIATEWNGLKRVGLTYVAIHEVGHVLGLHHPFITSHADNKFSKAIAFNALETPMSYGNAWGPAFSLREIFYGMYATRTYFSIFDLDSIDRGVIVDLLLKAQRNIRQLYDMGLADYFGDELSDIEFYYESAITLFKQQVYFDRLKFRGLGAQFASAFDYAYAAYVESRRLLATAISLEPLLRKYNDYVRELESLRGESARLRRDVEELQGENARLRELAEQVGRDAELYKYGMGAALAMAAALALRRRFRTSWRAPQGGAQYSAA